MLLAIGAAGALFNLVNSSPGSQRITWQYVASVAAFPAAYCGLFFWARRFTPVKFEYADAARLRFRFANDDYAAEFKRLNPSSGSSELYFSP
ncbi:hypothetical protein LRH25_02850 [Ideonella azotifigens]|uniref:hypothetical protein n=1 Tax=Ideonella azotifigens TaxID=513160 RepID=UPI0011418562|nr:hypothetical protein [Ideonella azotifigens]MCD2339274.1 hypothetical protein [Ideonella azotifigens]